MATYYDAGGKKIPAKKARNYLKQLKAAQASGAEYAGEPYYTKDELGAMYGTYYDDKGKALTPQKAAQYVTKLQATEEAGMPLAGRQYYTAEQLSQKYGGYSPQIIAALGSRAQYLTEAPGAYQARTAEELQKAAENRYAMTYGLQEAAALNQRDANVLALQQQQPGIERNYAAQLLSSNKQHAAAYDTLKGAMASRGLGRSSYAGAVAGNQLLARDAAAGQIEGQKTTALNQLQQQIAAQHSTYNNTIAQLAANRANEQAAYMDQLRQEDFANQQAAAAGRMDTLNAILGLPKANKGKKSAPKKGAGGASGAGGAGAVPGTSPGGTTTDDILNTGNKLPVYT